MPSPTEISVAQLMRLIGSPEAPVLISTCDDDDFAADPVFLPGAFAHPFGAIEALVPQLSGQRVVVYCKKGGKLSQGAAALLRCHGIAAETLEGGILAWREAGGPLVPAAAIPEPRPTTWVTRHRPKIDRIACPWLIRRFVDPQARFLFVAPSEVLLVVESFGAVPFDVEDVFWSHRAGNCSFDTMIEEFHLTSDPLARLAAIVRGADTDRLDLAPEAAGLLAVSLGLSRMFRDDLAQLEAGMVIYDALYRWCRDARDEGHNWPGMRG